MADNQINKESDIRNEKVDDSGSSNDFMHYRPKFREIPNSSIQRQSARLVSGLQNASMRIPSINSLSLLSSNGMNTVRQSSDKGKKDMQVLNERLACYIEKVRFLEAQNNKLSEELKRLKMKWGKETNQVKAMYQTELDNVRSYLDEVLKDKSKLEIKIASLEQTNKENLKKLVDSNKQNMTYRENFEKQSQQLCDLESEVSMLRRRIDMMELDKKKDEEYISSLQNSLATVRRDLNNETLALIDEENRRQSLADELAFIKEIHEQEKKELEVLAYKDSTVENREYWKSEMGTALRDIQKIYDDKLDTMKGEIDMFYSRKLQDLTMGASKQSVDASNSKEESKRLRLQYNELKERFNDCDAKNNQLARDFEVLKNEYNERDKAYTRENEDLKMEVTKLKAEIEAMLFELQNIIDAKLGLELEIAAYRKLLEGEESRPGASLKNIVDGFNDMYPGEGVIDNRGSAYTFSSPSNSASVFSVNRSIVNDTSTDFTSDSMDRSAALVKGEMNAKTNYQKSAKGPLSVSECSPDGKYIVIDNSSRKKMESLAGWKIVRSVDNLKTITYTFGEGVSIDANSKIKVWARGAVSDLDAKGALVCAEDSWGVGMDITTRLLNPSGEEKACHIQKTSYV